MKKHTRKCEVCIHRDKENSIKCFDCDLTYNKFAPDKDKINGDPFDQRILQYIKQIFADNNYTPTYSIMAQHFKCSKQTINHYMLILEANGDVVFSPNRRAYFLKQS